MKRLLFAAFLLLLSQQSFADTPTTHPEDVFKANGLIHQGFLLVLPQEANVHTAVRNLRGAKAKFGIQLRTQKELDSQIANLTRQVGQLTAEYGALNQRLSRISDPEAQNQVIGQINSIVAQHDQDVASIEAKQQQRDDLTGSRSAYVNVATQTADQAEAVATQYAALAQDTDLAAAIAAANQTAIPHFRLGPTGNFADDLAFIRQCRAAIPSGVVPVTFKDMTPQVEVFFNGNVKCDMIWDSGASFVSINSATADQIGLHPTDKDPVLKATIADGETVEAKLMTIPSIRIGEFTVKNVQCAVMPPSQPDSPNLLGGTFQSNFVFRLDDAAGELHLTPVADDVTSETVTPQRQ